jgi:glycosyltransferase involved in cell wall biosynthesis
MVCFRELSIGIVVATYNRPRSLMRLLNNIDSQVRIDLKSCVKVCVVDDGSDIDLTGLFPPCRFGFIYIYRNRNEDDLPRVYSSRNIAAGHVIDADLILQLDDDLEFNERALSEMQNLAALYDEGHGDWAWIARVSDNHDIEDVDDYSRGRDGRWYDGRARLTKAKYTDGGSAGLLMPARTWLGIEGYDEHFDFCMGVADQEMLLRIQKIGGDLMLAPYFMNIDDSESGSWRESMIDRAVSVGRSKNEVLFNTKHPDRNRWNSV